MGSLNDVQTFSNNDNALITSNVGGITDFTLASTSQSQGGFGFNFPSSFLSGEFWDPTEDGPNAYISAIRDSLSQLPEVCSATGSIRFGKGPLSVGVSWKSQTGFSSSGRVTAPILAGGANTGVSITDGRVRPTVSVPIPGTPFSAGATGTQDGRVASVNASARWKVVDVQAAANLGQRFGCR
jgi:hypothetical protein